MADETRIGHLDTRLVADGCAPVTLDDHDDITERDVLVNVAIPHYRIPVVHGFGVVEQQDTVRAVDRP
ncbi:MAG: hypothetical protein ACPGQN_05970, partial [Candidatus Poseidoniaceae archaeon]